MKHHVTGGWNRAVERAAIASTSVSGQPSRGRLGPQSERFAAKPGKFSRTLAPQPILNPSVGMAPDAPSTSVSEQPSMGIARSEANGRALKAGLRARFKRSRSISPRSARDLDHWENYCPGELLPEEAPSTSVPPGLDGLWHSRKEEEFLVLKDMMVNGKWRLKRSGRDLALCGADVEIGGFFERGDMSIKRADGDVWERVSPIPPAAVRRRDGRRQQGFTD